MNKAEIESFIEELGHLGDEWTEEQVVRVYGDWNYQDAIDDRKSDLMQVAQNIVALMEADSREEV